MALLQNGQIWYWYKSTFRSLFAVDDKARATKREQAELVLATDLTWQIRSILSFSERFSRGIFCCVENIDVRPIGRFISMVYGRLKIVMIV